MNTDIGYRNIYLLNVISYKRKSITILLFQASVFTFTIIQHLHPLTLEIFFLFSVLSSTSFYFSQKIFAKISFLILAYISFKDKSHVFYEFNIWRGRGT